MKSLLICTVFVGILATYVYAGNNYSWGIITDRDVLLSNETVSKTFVLGLSVSKKYVFKQKDKLNPYTIVAIKVTDKKKSNGATVTLVSGGVGSKNVTLLFTSQRGHGIKDVVEIYGR